MRIGRLLHYRRRRNREFWLGDQARDRCLWQEAAGHYEKALAIQPERAALWVQYGHALKETGDLAAGEHAYRKAIALAPDVADTYLQLGHALKLQGRIAEAAAAYRKAAGLAPGVADIHWQLGHVLELQGHMAEAAQAYRKTLDLAPDVAGTHLQLGHALKAQGRKEEAVAAYLDALALAPGLHAALLELYHLGWIYSGIDGSAITRARRMPRRAPPVAPPREAAASASCVVFDVSDLVQYFLHARAPTGIQRVVLAVVASLLRRPARDFDLGVACLAAGCDRWVAVPGNVFLRLTDLAVAGGEIDDPAWLSAWGELYFVLAEGERLEFRPGACLVNIGASWWLPDYFRMVRTAKSAGARYIPFVHDCIPALAPEHCDGVLARNFMAWLRGVFDHADGFLVNSRATAADLARVARLLARAVPEPAVIRFDACGAHLRNGDAVCEEAEIIARHGLADRDFVLFVSTIESRKNHPLAFDAWLAMIEERGLERTPTLVCVGNPGWQFEAIMRRLHASASLQSRVCVLSNLSDKALGVLYRHCLFTLYPSSHEGWGLPVTESLCHGKVPLIARASSLPEAGGDLAEYFDPACEKDFRDKLIRLIDDAAYRRGREAMIARCAALRDWAQIADDIVAGALDRAIVPGVRGSQMVPR
jgi:glycosyltransferase involved in cell wall biosynthesis/Tfp pilus assembly protein PilF